MAVQQRNFSSLRNASGALDDLEQATKADPRLVTAWMSLGLAYEQLPGLLGGSTRKALALAPWDPEVVYGYLDSLGSRETRKQLGDGEQKRRLAAEARRLLPPVRTRARALEAICDALLDAGQAEEAWRVAKEALGRADAPSLVRLQLGKLAARSGLHREEGLAFLDQVLREPLEGGSAGYPGAWWRKGQILKDLGRRPEAKAAAWEALKLDPKHPGAKKLMEEASS